MQKSIHDIVIEENKKGFSPAQTAARLGVYVLDVENILSGADFAYLGAKQSQAKEKESRDERDKRDKDAADFYLKEKARRKQESVERRKVKAKLHQAERRERIRNNPILGLDRRLKTLNKKLTAQDFINKVGANPVCYLTGKPLSYSEPQDYHIEHIIPESKGGSSELENLQIAWSKANIAKGVLDLGEFIQLCKDVAKRFE